MQKLSWLHSITDAAEDVKNRKDISVFRGVVWILVFVKGKAREIFVDEHCIMCINAQRLGAKIALISR